MGLREQNVEIGYSIQTITRNVYDIQNNEALKIQTGYVKYDNGEVPVWRPYSPGNMSHDAKWRNGTWKNIYNLRMPHKENTKYIEYNVVEYSEGDATAMLPEVQVTLMYEIREYISKQKT
ncbi:MAG: hypothetical protein AB1450_07375 [Pseudomonadota bacterium]